MLIGDMVCLTFHEVANDEDAWGLCHRMVPHREKLKTKLRLVKAAWKDKRDRMEDTGNKRLQEEKERRAGNNEDDTEDLKAMYKALPIDFFCHPPPALDGDNSLLDEVSVTIIRCRITFITDLRIKFSPL